METKTLIIELPAPTYDNFRAICLDNGVSPDYVAERLIAKFVYEVMPTENRKALIKLAKDLESFDNGDYDGRS